MKKPQIPVALEGVPFIGAGLFITLILALLHYPVAVLAGALFTLFSLYFFRDPERVAPSDPAALTSPADGKVIVVEKILDERFLQTQAYKVSIFMNVFNVHVNRMPAAGMVEDVIYSPGKFYSADTAKGGLENEYCTTILATEQDQRYAVTQIAGLIARRIVCWAEKGDFFAKGQRFGLIRFGSRVDLYLPLDSRIEVEKGQKVKAGETVIGYLR
ncbi:MAG: phosphatidylserine decarboxylase family protein [Desulfobulbaceae bacterium]|nr:MAG: phosphatidylserine decarboxylase family protein [Desulfobulbaceae bacterium]